MSGAIRFYQIRDGESRSEQTDLGGMIRLEQSKVKPSGGKRGRSEQIKNITEIERSRARR